MTDSHSRQTQMDNSRVGNRTPKYLPGQRSLFCVEPVPEVVSAESTPELFYTGKDLPGAKEREQVILWDVA
ncbi:hypothetical protein [Bythopirellula goksoeyrii]|uniref:Uncharacterized protein n=1 Tax=Bythopirellula goksoeyrii TaxID=1400387 RepID=A0A5B9QBZ4_9BACT|nr:hypothetical protein [Bythopirellula goksoeyrii]QEG35110.1 hypothetical protein Pr1d_24010 [Bythopirellula goksoeyrii]